jgi:hypothetical protein
MKLKKTITLNVSKEGKNIICYDIPTLHLIVGTTSVSGNYKMYGVEKQDNNRFVVSIDTLKKRIETLKRRRDKLDSSIELMEQVTQ